MKKMTQPTDGDKRRRKLIYWLFVFTVAMWAVAFAVFYIFRKAGEVAGGASAFGAAFGSSLIVLVIAAVLSVVAYFISETMAKKGK
jgi:amino acid transporter